MLLPIHAALGTRTAFATLAVAAKVSLRSVEFRTLAALPGIAIAIPPRTIKFGTVAAKVPLWTIELRAILARA
jgi:hypothetical protein